MKKRVWNFEAIGLFLVFLSLLFVGYEIRQNTILASAQALRDLAELGQGELLLVAQSEELSELIDKGLVDFSALSQSEQRRYIHYVYSIWNTYEVAYRFHLKGVLNEVDLRPWAESMCKDYENDGHLLSDGYISLDAAFLDFLESRC